MNPAEYLANCDYFKGVGVHSRELLARICAPRQLPRKAILFSEGNRGRSLFILTEGAVGLHKTSETGELTVIKVVQPGELFGEVILFEHDRYPVSAVAMAASRLYEIPRDRFYSLLEREDFRNDFIAMLMRKQRYLAERIRYLTTYDAEERFFVFLREQFGGQHEITPNISKKDIAAVIGTTPETYSRLLARLARERKIRLRGRTMYLNRRLTGAQRPEDPKPPSPRRVTPSSPSSHSTGS
jgi:CRP-like cAMP-binding protein